MNRRTFFKVTYGVSGLLVCRQSLFASDSSRNKKVIRFGVVTDLHYNNGKDAGDRSYKQSMNKLDEAITVFNKSDVDFVIELGDFTDQWNNRNREQNFSALDEIENEFKKFNGNRYHVLGNHDLDNLTKADFLAHTENSGKAKGKNYYSFEQKGIKFIVLDGNYTADGSDNYLRNWKIAFISDAQKVWLEKELNTKRPVIVFTHQLLDSFSDDDSIKELCVGDAADIVEILERRNNVLAVFQGHCHWGHYSFQKGIHYFTLKSMIGDASPENSSFAIVEVDKSLNISIDGFYKCEDKYLEKTKI